MINSVAQLKLTRASRAAADTCLYFGSYYLAKRIKRPHTLKVHPSAGGKWHDCCYYHLNSPRVASWAILSLASLGNNISLGLVSLSL